MQEFKIKNKITEEIEFMLAGSWRYIPQDKDNIFVTYSGENEILQILLIVPFSSSLNYTSYISQATHISQARQALHTLNKAHLSHQQTLPKPTPYTAIHFDTWVCILNYIAANTNMYSCSLPKRTVDFPNFLYNLILENSKMKIKYLIKKERPEEYVIHQFKLKIVGFVIGTLEFNFLIQSYIDKLEEAQKEIDNCFSQLILINQETQYDLFEEIIQQLLVKLKKLEQIQF